MTPPAAPLEGWPAIAPELSAEPALQPASTGTGEASLLAAEPAQEGPAAPERVCAAILATVPPLRQRQSVVSVDDRPYPPGAMVAIDDLPTTLRHASFLAFVDLAPANSWPHDCLYVLCDEAGTARVRKGRLPPRLAGERSLRVLARGDDVPPWGATPPYRR